GLLLAWLAAGWLVLSALVLLAVVAYCSSVAAAVRCPPDEPHPLALRLLVAFLHVVQPLVRTMGRLRGKPGLPRPGPDERWTGDRTSWVSRLRRDLAGRRCAVRLGGPHDDWDLEVQMSLLVVCRIRTAVAWGWVPRHRVNFRPTLLPWLTVVAAGVALAGTVGMDAVLPVFAAGSLLVAAALLDGRRLHRVVEGVME